MADKIRKEKVVQAVVLADDFTTKLTPIQNVYPSILMPIINIPLLDYLMEILIKSRVEEVFLYCSSHVDQLKKYVAERDIKDLTIVLVISDGCRSLGDALRDIDTKGLIRGYFVLIRGDAFINANLKDALDIHCMTCKTDKGTAMSMILRNFGSTNDSCLREEVSLVVSDKTKKKILYYNKLKNDEKKVKLELTWFLDHDEIDISSCFLDTHVYLCSPSVLPLFSDNFDFQTIEDFIRGVLMNEEILNSRIYWQQLNPQDYSLPISSWKAYHALNRDILQRYSFPLAPDAFPSLKNFIYMPRSMYKHRSATIAKGCILEKDCILGQKSVLGKNTFVTRSVIGNNCIIGSDVTIKNSYILSDVNVGNNCIIESSVILPNCVIQENVNINGCIISKGMNINGHNKYIDSVLESNSSGISETKMADLEDNEEYLYFKEKEIVESDSCSTDLSTTDEDSDRDSPVTDDVNMFLTEVIDSLLRGYQDKLNCENLILEINSSRYAYNVTMRELTFNVIKAILSLPLHYLSETKTPVDNLAYQKNLKSMLAYFHPIILNYVKTKDAQDDCLCAIEEVATTTHELLSFLKNLLHYLYDRDILEEDKILEWYDSESTDIEEFQYKEIRKAVKPFITWLQEAEEDSSESESD